MNFFKSLFFSVGKVLSYLIPLEKLKAIIRMILGYFRAGLVQSKFKYFGKNVFVGKNIVLHGQEFISIGNSVSLAANGTLTAWSKYGDKIYYPEIIIDDYAIIGEGFHITAIAKIHIGKGVLTGKYVTISDNSHGEITAEELKKRPSERDLYSKGTVIIKDNVWIGDKVTILPNVTIGKNAIIGANSVVTKDVADNAVVAGNPAKIIKIINDK